MILRDFGKVADAKLQQWLLELITFTRNRVSFKDNIDCVLQVVSLGTGETRVSHNLNRVPQGVIEVAAFPNGTVGISFTQPPTGQFLYLKRAVAGECTLMIF